MEHIHFKGWTDEDRQNLQSAQSFHSLARIAVGIIVRRGGPLHGVSGPISTGGVGTREGNLRVFRAMIEHLVMEEGLEVFSPVPFELKIGEFARAWKKLNPDEKYCWPILDDFYEKVFATGVITKVHFLHGFGSSIGATWEHKGCDRWKIERRMLSRDLSEMLLHASAR